MTPRRVGAPAEYGSARYALAVPTCTGRVWRDFLFLPWSLVRYFFAALRYRVLPPCLFHGRDLRPFMCPVCWRGGVWDDLIPSGFDDDGHAEESECPRCQSVV